MIRFQNSQEYLVSINISWKLSNIRITENFSIFYLFTYFHLENGGIWKIVN